MRRSAPAAPSIWFSSLPDRAYTPGCMCRVASEATIWAVVNASFTPWARTHLIGKGRASQSIHNEICWRLPTQRPQRQSEWCDDCTIFQRDGCSYAHISYLGRAQVDHVGARTQEYRTSMLYPREHCSPLMIRLPELVFYSDAAATQLEKNRRRDPDLLCLCSAFVQCY